MGAKFASAQQVALTELPDAPGLGATDSSSVIPSAADGSHTQTSPAALTRNADRLDKVILPGEAAPRLTVFDKSLLGVRHVVSPFSAMGWVFAATYAQATDGAPNYGQSFDGYGKRIGAAALHGATNGIFSDAIGASVLHEDPRYYKMGSGKNVVERFFYAATRPVITRTDGGTQTVNFALLGGNLAGAALTQAYYPSANRGFHEVVKTFGTSIGGAALGFEFSEFIADPWEILHLKRNK